MSTPAGNEAREASPALWVGDWRVDPSRNELSRGSESVKLEPKVIEVLVLLARRAGQVVGREELLAAAWPGVVVGDDALTQAIIKLRRALDDDAHRPKFIETISKRGYRLIAPVAEAGKALAAATQPRKSFLHRNRIVIAAAVCVLLVSVGALLVFPELAKTVATSRPIVVDEKGELPMPSRPIIAVLPLSNQSGDPKRDYFSDGVTEDIINALGRFSGVGVISRNAVEAFKGKSVLPRAIRNELGARYIVQGSVREADGRLRVAVEMSDTEKGTLLWSDRYDGEGKEVFEIQDRIVRNIVGALAVKLTRLELERVSTKPVESLEAYDLVLRARELLYRLNRETNRQARGMLAKAVQLAPNYAEAYVALAHAEYHRAAYGWIEDPENGMRRAEAYARRALTIEDPGAHARAHGLLARIYSSFGNYDQALAEANRAIKLNPSDTFAQFSRGSILVWLGRMDEGIAAFETAHRFEPGASSDDSFLAAAHYTQGRYREALAIADLAIARFPDVTHLHGIRTATLGQMGNFEESRNAAAQLRRLDPFAKVEHFGTRYKNPEHTAKLQEGLRKAGF